MVTESQVKLVQDSWEKVVPIAPQAAELFYGKLFEMDPDLKPLFTSNMEEQGKKLMDMITLAVRGLGDLEKLVPALESLGKKHVDYKVLPEHYDTVGRALLWTLEQGLGPEIFTDDCRDAWAAIYKVMSDTMIAASY